MISLNYKLEKFYPIDTLGKAISVLAKWKNLDLYQLTDPDGVRQGFWTPPCGFSPNLENQSPTAGGDVVVWGKTTSGELKFTEAGPHLDESSIVEMLNISTDSPGDFESSDLIPTLAAANVGILNQVLGYSSGWTKRSIKQIIEMLAL